MVQRVVVGVLCWIALGAAAYARAGGEDPFQDADVTDEIGLARLAEEAGDAALVALLRAAVPRQHALMAVRASPYARAPEALLTPLVKLACARDPALAPEAGWAVFQIAGALTQRELSAREALRDDLHKARAAFACAEVAPKPRADIAALLTQSATSLDALLR